MIGFALILSNMTCILAQRWPPSGVKEFEPGPDLPGQRTCSIGRLLGFPKNAHHATKKEWLVTCHEVGIHSQWAWKREVSHSQQKATPAAESVGDTHLFPRRERARAHVLSSPPNYTCGGEEEWGDLKEHTLLSSTLQLPSIWELFQWQGKESLGLEWGCSFWEWIFHHEGNLKVLESTQGAIY